MSYFSIFLNVVLLIGLLYVLSELVRLVVRIARVLDTSSAPQKAASRAVSVRSGRASVPASTARSSVSRSSVSAARSVADEEAKKKQDEAPVRKEMAASNDFMESARVQSSLFDSIASLSSGGASAGPPAPAPLAPRRQVPAAARAAPVVMARHIVNHDPFAGTMPLVSALSSLIRGPGQEDFSSVKRFVLYVSWTAAKLALLVGARKLIGNIHATLHYDVFRAHDCMVTGDHSWTKSSVCDLIETWNPLLRAAGTMLADFHVSSLCYLGALVPFFTFTRLIGAVFPSFDTHHVFGRMDLWISERRMWIPIVFFVGVEVAKNLPLVYTLATSTSLINFDSLKFTVADFFAVAEFTQIKNVM